MGAVGNYLTFINDEDPVTVDDCRQAVSDDQNGIFTLEVADSSLDLLLSLVIQSAGGLVKEDYFSLLE